MQAVEKKINLVRGLFRVLSEEDWEVNPVFQLHETGHKQFAMARFCFLVCGHAINLNLFVCKRQAPYPVWGLDLVE